MIIKKFLFGLLCSTQLALGMQQTEFMLNDPYFDSKKREFIIDARDQNNKIIGSMHYYPLYGKSVWYMRELKVNIAYQKKGIGRLLLAEFLARAKCSNATALEWRILPSAGMSEEQLVSIYFRMLEKIDPELLKKTSLDYRGSDFYTSTFIIVDLV